MRNKARRTRRVWFSSCISSQIEIDCEAALDTPSEIARNHFVARRAMMLRMAERAVRNGGTYRAGLTEIDRDWPRLSGSATRRHGTETQPQLSPESLRVNADEAP